MGWTLRLIESPYEHTPYFELKEGKTDGDLPVVGDCWFAPELLVESKRPPWMHLAPNYFKDWAGKRPPICVVLPDRTTFCVDAMAWSNGKPYGSGWSVTGDAPLITVSPSINVGGSYHGYIQNGIITDDVEGRKFR